MNAVVSRGNALFPTRWFGRRARSLKRVGDNALHLVAVAVCATAASLYAAPAPGAGLQQSFTGTNVKATLLIPGDLVPRFGFVPVRVSIDNRENRDLRWEARFTQSSFSNSGLSTGSMTSVNLLAPAGRSGERWVFLPTAETGHTRGGGYYGTWGNLAVSVDGTGISEKNLSFNTSGRGGQSMQPWAVSASLEALVRAQLLALKADTSAARPGSRPGRGAPTPPGGRPLLTGAPNLFSFDPQQAFGDWRVWSPFTRVLLRADEHAALPPANRAALRQWVALGGQLYLAPEAAAAGRTERLGAGQIVHLREPIAAGNRTDPERLFTAGGIFGSTPAAPQDLALPKEGLVKKVSPARVVGDWLVYFFVGFAVLVAPVNLFAIAPVKRRHWLFLSLPAISLAAVTALVVAIYLQDGVGGEGARRALVVLVPGEPQAAVFQEQVSRTGLLLGTQFPLADDTVCAAIELEDGGIPPGRMLEFRRQEGRASGDWFRGRARQAQHLRRLTPTRARVEQVGVAPDGAPIVQSSVGATLREFRYLDGARAAWGAETLPPGTRVTLQRLPDGKGGAATARAFSPAGGSEHFQNLVRASVQAGEPGRFVALAGDSELAPLPTLSSIRWLDSSVLITGVVEGADAAGRATP